jgi:hypothetical protein
MRQTWLLQCNPDRFDIDAFLRTQPVETNWLLRQHGDEIAPGDQVFIWRAIGKGSEAASGIVAEAEVLADPRRPGSRRPLGRREKSSA